MAIKRFIKLFVIMMIMILIVIQFIPVTYTNPPVINEPNWDSPQTRSIAVRACFNCHSNETDLPWYSTIAPVSWLIYNDIGDGRKDMNFSEWKLKSNKAEHLNDEIKEVISEGKMPPWYYLPLHPEAKLTADEKKMLIEGLQRTVSNSITETDK
jgi:hypothetical protein